MFVIVVLLLYFISGPLGLNVPGYSIFCQCSRLACNQLMDISLKKGMFCAKTLPFLSCTYMLIM